MMFFRCGWARGLREADAHAEAAVGHGAGGDGGVVCGRDGPDDGQSEPVPVLVGRPARIEPLEGLEEAFDFRWPDEWSGVGHRQDGLAVLHPGPDLDTAAGNVVADGVGEQVGDEPFDEQGVAIEGCRFGHLVDVDPEPAGLGLQAGQGRSDPGTSTSPGTGSGTGGGGTPAAQPASGPTLLADEWAACERSHGDPDQADPTIDANGAIHIIIPKGAQPAGNLHERTGTCGEYLAAAQNQLRAANPVAAPPDQSEYVKYVACMRTNGVPDYPYPTGDQTTFIGTGVDPDSPSVERVNQLCGKKIGAPAWWINGTDTPGSIEVHTAGINPNATPPACIFAKVNPCSGTVTVPAGSGAPGTSSGSGANG